MVRRNGYKGFVMAESSSHDGFTYRAFVSYSHKDKTWADWLHKALETWRVPSRLVGTETAHGTIPRRLIPIFRDRDELASADSLAEKVNAALAQSENLIVICSPASAASPPRRAPCADQRAGSSPRTIHRRALRKPAVAARA